MTTVTISEAGATLPLLIDRVCNGGTVTITRHGRPVAAIVEPSERPVIEIGDIHEFAENLRMRLEKAATRPIRQVQSRPGWADEMVARIRADRDSE